MVFDLIEALGVTLTPAIRDAHLHHDPHRHRRLPFFAHHATNVRNLAAGATKPARSPKRSPAPCTTAARWRGCG
jgi:hypothetical protein